MALYDAKIEKFSKKVEQLERNIKRDTEERRRLLSEIDRLRYLSL
jgi:cell division protein FtsB